MSSEALRKSRRRTTAFLLDARAHLSEAAEGICAREIFEFEAFIGQNELELALDMLEEAFEKSGTWRALELMAQAALSMGLVERQRRYDEQLSKGRGWTYRTVLPTDR